MISRAIDFVVDYWWAILGAIGAVATIVVIALLVGSGISSGTITKKWHEDGHYYWTTQCFTTTSGSGNVSTHCYPVQQYDDEDWGFDLEDCTDPDEDCKTGDVEVSEEVWNSLNEGDYYDGGK